MRIRGLDLRVGSRRGSVLIIVLWVSFGLVALALYFAHSMSLEMRAADNRSAAMAAESRLSHRGWDAALRKAGLTDDALGENVAYNYATPEAVMRGWMQSPGHRANILRPDFKRIGIGCVVDARGHRWWTQDFAG